MNTINQFLDSHSHYSTHILRTILGLVFVYFGWTSLTTPDMWTGFVPAWTSIFGAAETLVKMHGIVEIAFGLMLILDILTSYVAAFLFLDILHILTLLSFGPVWIRDFGLSGSMLSLVFKRNRV